MPKLKPSRNRVEIAAPCSLGDFIYEELCNLRSWNPTTITQSGRLFQSYTKDGFLWSILALERRIIVRSKQPVVHIRMGLKIMMGSGQIIIN